MIYRFKIKLFKRREIYNAYDHSMDNGVALHVYRAMKGQFPDAPDCFLQSAQWGHLLCQNEHALNAIAYHLGVRKIVIGRAGEKRQHVDLCLGPLKEAIKIAQSGDIVELIPHGEEGGDVYELNCGN